MVFDEKLVVRVREHLTTRPGYSEQKMFGGLCYLLNGNMCCSVDNSLARARKKKAEV